MALPVCSPLVHLKNANVLISPGSQLNPDVLSDLDSVTDIVGSSLYHLAGIPKASSIFSEAKKWGPPGCRKKRKDVQWSNELVKEVWPYQDELPIFALEGIPSLNEIVFIHRASKSLIVTDLIFNMQEIQGLGATLIFKMFGTYKRFGISSFFMRQVKDKPAFFRSLDVIMAEPFENVIVSHGQNVFGNGHGMMSEAIARRAAN